MLEKPDLDDEQLVACLHRAYGVHIRHIAFLPLGADADTAAYRAVASTGTNYFVKLRRGVFNRASVTVPKWLGEHHVDSVIAPLTTNDGQLWTHLGPFTVVLYPFVAGRNAYEVALSDAQWRAFGSTIQRLHTAAFPAALVQDLPRETYSSRDRERMITVLSQLADTPLPDDVAREAAALMKTKRAETLDLVSRAEQRAETMRARSPEWTVCHADVHAGNLLIDERDHLYVIDWDTLILAPKERDLMFVGGGQGFVGRTAAEEITAFHRGYGEANLDHTALAYYRYERIVQDIAIYCEELLLSAEGGADRAQSLRYLGANYQPGGTIAAAYAADTQAISF